MKIECESYIKETGRCEKECLYGKYICCVLCDRAKIGSCSEICLEAKKIIKSKDDLYARDYPSLFSIYQL